MTEINPIVIQQQLLHDCRLCGGTVYHKVGYETEICPDCVRKATNSNGESITIFAVPPIAQANITSFVVKTSNGTTTNDERCFIRWTECVIVVTQYGQIAVLIK